MTESVEALAEKVRQGIVGHGYPSYAAGLAALDALVGRLAEAEKQIAKWQRVADGIERACQAAEADRDKQKLMLSNLMASYSIMREERDRLVEAHLVAHGRGCVCWFSAALDPEQITPIKLTSRDKIVGHAINAEEMAHQAWRDDHRSKEKP